MSKLASHSIITMTFPPITIAFSLLQLLVFGDSDQFMLTMSKSAFLPIIAVAQFWECFAEFSFMLERIGFADCEITIPLFWAITICASILDISILEFWHWFSLVFKYYIGNLSLASLYNMKRWFSNIPLNSIS